MKNVLLLDSGSGGVNILKECVKVCPYCNFLMFCDGKNLPYGSKTKQKLQMLVLENLKNIYTFFKYDIVIFACNTLSCTCLEIARKTFPDIVFIGTVPAVKPALEKFLDKDILVLATEATLSYNVLINKHPDLIKQSLPTLASDIDENLDNLQVLEHGLRQKLDKFKPKAVVLGCTHYVAVLPILQKIFGEQTAFFDSANGVARRLKSFVSQQSENYQVQIVSTGNKDDLAKFWWWYNL